MDCSPDVKNRFIEGISQAGAGIATDHQMSSLRHESRHVPDILSHNNVHAFHRNSTARRRAALDHQQTAVSRCAGAFRSEALDPHSSRHHVFAHAPSNVSLHRDVSLLVHSSQKISSVCQNPDPHWHSQTDSDAVKSGGVEDLELLDAVPRKLFVEVLVEFSDAETAEV